MKTLKLSIILVLFFASASAFAQYGYGGYYPYGGNMGGVDRTVDTQRNAVKAKDRKKAKENTKKDFIQLTVEHLSKKLNLDDFQAAAITNIYNDYRSTIMTVSSEDAPTSVLKDKMRKIVEEIDAKIFPLLGKEQLEKYNTMIAEREKN